MSLQRKTMHSVASSSVIQMCSQVLNFGISILIARILSPEEFGIVAIGLVFVALAQTLSDLGLSSSLIQKTDITDDETFSCFSGTLKLFCCLLSQVVNSSVDVRIIATVVVGQRVYNRLRFLSCCCIIKVNEIVIVDFCI